MFDKSQLMRGTLEGCILKIISLEVTYGYEIMLKLTGYGFNDIREGTIYPLLVRLEKKDLICGEFKPSPLGPSRKYYFITKRGKEALNSFEAYWQSISVAVTKILSLEVK
ncbi:PadR family transcriptional regulator [Desulfosporosinus meridiei]|uniref:Putative transcriptional regulator n=1 Tax=Desulfosporosinus meridiei (strain ATCC BAA-275 / DSM 13257 / KCTC 12902 / NCIMB 13706 / S10) TaxID=768704 RepID=J7IZU3_DESMD|nr:PadR family transcriptional regulator [Desulfosporosinus meridiei]AFQ44231.1 putative transcriptional regulator [Desulfosporosinus meridiei DSM 13257]